MKAFVKYIIFLFLFLVASFIGLGSILYFKYIKTYNFYLTNKDITNKNTYCFFDINKKLDVNAYIQKQNLITSIGQKHVSLTVPYDYVLSYILQNINTFDYSNTNVPVFLRNGLSKLEPFYRYVFRIFKPEFIKNKRIPVVCINIIDKNNAKLFLAKNWWAFAETNINVNNNKLKVEDLRIDSFNTSEDLVSLINSKISDNVNIVPNGVNVYLGKNGLLLNYKIQDLIIKTN